MHLNVVMSWIFAQFCQVLCFTQIFVVVEYLWRQLASQRRLFYVYIQESRIWWAWISSCNFFDWYFVRLLNLNLLDLILFFVFLSWNSYRRIFNLDYLLTVFNFSLPRLMIFGWLLWFWSYLIFFSIWWNCFVYLLEWTVFLWICTDLFALHFRAGFQIIPKLWRKRIRTFSLNLDDGFPQTSSISSLVWWAQFVCWKITTAIEAIPSLLLLFRFKFVSQFLLQRVRVLLLRQF